MSSLTAVTTLVVLAGTVSCDWSTLWCDRDDPSGTGDYETYNGMAQVSPDCICEPHGVPIAVECRTIYTGEVFPKALWWTTGQVFSHPCMMDNPVGTSGIQCRNQDQPPGGPNPCYDYEVQFRCRGDHHDHDHDELCRHCCPKPEFIMCPESDDRMCDENVDCPRNTACCPSSCEGRNVCVKPEKCCCPNDTSEISPAEKLCRDDEDCLYANERCCWAGPGWAGSPWADALMCRPGEPCPCPDLCCPIRQRGIQPHPQCQHCHDDNQCPPNKLCCLDQNGCAKCTKGYVNGADCTGSRFDGPGDFQSNSP